MYSVKGEEVGFDAVTLQAYLGGKRDLRIEVGEGLVVMLRGR